MTKGLEALEELKTTCDTWLRPSINNLQDDRFSIVEKELKALEIIKNVGAIAFILDKWRIQQVITKEEFDLLKEVLL